jgi:hypothetical protein
MVAVVVLVTAWEQDFLEHLVVVAVEAVRLQADTLIHQIKVIKAGKVLAHISKVVAVVVLVLQVLTEQTLAVVQVELV